MRWLIALVGLLVVAAPSAPAVPGEPPLIVYAAGSTTGALGAILKRYEQDTGQPVELKTGPAGLMRERIEAGDRVDLFVSANMAHPLTLMAAGRGGPVVRFARNRLCVYARPALRLTRAGLLDRLLDPKVRIGTSTPGADPGGDYALEFFAKADTVRPGATALLRAKARQVVGGRIENVNPKGLSALETMNERAIDVSIGYCSSRSTTPDTSVDKIELPDELATYADYGMTITTASHDAARQAAAGQLAMFLLTPAAQAMLPAYGFQKTIE